MHFGAVERRARVTLQAVVAAPALALSRSGSTTSGDAHHKAVGHNGPVLDPRYIAGFAARLAEHLGSVRYACFRTENHNGGAAHAIILPILEPSRVPSATEAPEPRPLLLPMWADSRPRGAGLTSGRFGYCGFAGSLNSGWSDRLERPSGLAIPSERWFHYNQVVAIDPEHLEVVINVTHDVHRNPKSSPVDADGGGGPFDETLERFIRLIEAVEALLGQPELALARGHGFRGRASFSPWTTRAAFENVVRRGQDFVRAGDVQQVVLSQRFSAAVSVDPIQLFAALTARCPAPHQFVLIDGTFALVGASPERLVRVANRVVTTNPIAGTCPLPRVDRSVNDAAAALRSNRKEVAEHMMLVDLARSDVGRIAEIGSVNVSKLLRVERHGSVLHLVSEVRGRLRSEFTPSAALGAAFPAGTLSGAPRIRATEIIEELEEYGRGPYGGAIGYVDASGKSEAAILIRTAFVEPGVVSVQAGAGVVRDSTPYGEYSETIRKLGTLFELFGGDLNAF